MGSQLRLGAQRGDRAGRWRRRWPGAERLERRSLLALSPMALASPLPFHFNQSAQVSGFLATPGGVELYSTTLQAGDMIDASIAAQATGGGLDSLLRVFNSSGTPLALDNQEGGDPHLSFEAAAPGTYYIGVSSAPNDSYDPTVPSIGGTGGTTAAYALDVHLAHNAPLLPDMTGSSFRTGVDMAAAGDTVPVSFTVENRGGGRPGQFPGPGAALHQQPLRPLVGDRAGDAHPRPTGRRRDRPGFLVAAGTERHAAGGVVLGTGVPRPADLGRPVGARGRSIR